MAVLRAILICVFVLIALVGCGENSEDQTATAEALAQLAVMATENAQQLTALANEAATLTASTPTYTYTPSITLTRHEFNFCETKAH